MKRINSFTLIETVVVMVISSVVIVAGYYAFSSTSKRMQVLQSNAVQYSGWTQMNLLLYKDMEEGLSASWIPPGQLVIAREDAGDINYRFQSDLTIRETETQTDTFKIALEKITTIDLEYDRVYLSEISLQLRNENPPVRLSYHKSYTPYFLMTRRNE